MSFELKVSKENLAPSLVSCFFQDSPEVHINIFWSQQTFQFFNPHLHTVTSFQKLFRPCDDCSFSRLPSSSQLPWSLSKEVYEFCTGAGGVILFLESGGAFTGKPSYLISSCVSVHQCARFLEKGKVCGSTSSHSERQGETKHNSVTKDEGETGTSVTSGTTRTSSQETSSRADRSSGLYKRSSQERSPQLSRSLP